MQLAASSRAISVYTRCKMSRLSMSKSSSQSVQQAAANLRPSHPYQPATRATPSASRGALKSCGGHLRPIRGHLHPRLGVHDHHHHHWAAQTAPHGRGMDGRLSASAALGCALAVRLSCRPRVAHPRTTRGPTGPRVARGGMIVSHTSVGEDRCPFPLWARHF